MPESSRLASVGRMEEADEIFKSFAEGSNYQQGQNWPGNGSMRHNKATNKGFLPIWIDLLLLIALIPTTV